MIDILVDGREITTTEGEILLKVCLDNDIYVPNLCFMADEASPHASCRLCYVEIEGRDEPVAACTVRVREGMRVRTDGEAARELQRTGLKLLLSTHRIECKECPANRRCPLQEMARVLKVKLKSDELPKLLKPVDREDGHPCLVYYPNRCILCAKCVRVCRRAGGPGALTFVRRGIETAVGWYEPPAEAGAACAECRACIEICPVKALLGKEDPEAGQG